MKNVIDLIHKEGYKLNNVDCTVILEKPKLNPHIPIMQKVLAEIMEVEIIRLSLKTDQILKSLKRWKMSYLKNITMFLPVPVSI